MKRNDLIVVGGGAAGMLAALFASRAGASTTLLERNEKLGKKLYITGKGRCNVTNLCDTEEFLRNVPRNPRFLYSALHFFGPEDMLRLLSQLGCDTKIERGRRAFPVSDHASDVTKALERGLNQSGVAIHLNARVKALDIADGRVQGVKLENGQTLPAKAVIVCTGGLSYPATGSTGDGLAFAREAGHPVTAIRPSLAGLITKEDWPRALQGLTLKNVCLTGRSCGKIIYSELGEMLFTHFGISGPLAIELSSHLPDTGLADGVIDLKPGLTLDQTERRLTRELAGAGKKRLSTVMQALLPQRFAALFPGLCDVNAEKMANQVTAEERLRLARALKSLPLTVMGTRPIAEAIVTRGGVDVASLRPASLASRLIDGLYFAGEIIDVDAHTGGYNLQIAFSTGALAGKSAAEFLTQNEP